MGSVCTPRSNRRKRSMPSNSKPVDAPIPLGLVKAEGLVQPAAVIAFTEGPAVDLDGNVFFSDIQNNRIMKLAASGELSIFRADSGRANGNMFDREGRLVTCEGDEFGPGGRRRVTRTNMQTGEVEVLTDSFDGKKYNSPNDVCIDTQGNIFFTDPRYDDPAGKELDVEGVYRIDTAGNVKRVLDNNQVQKPNGLALTPDDSTLYVIDSNPLAGGNRKIWAFAVGADGSMSEQRLVYDFGKGRGGDGMRVDMNGNLWVAAGINRPRGRPSETLDVPTGVYIITPAGEILGRIPIPEETVTNLTFGPPNRTTLYVTSGKTLFTIPIGVSGYVLYA